MLPVVAYQVANTISIKSSKPQLPWQLLFQDSDELFYLHSKDKYIYLFQYGMVSFFNLSKAEINEALQAIKPFCDTYFADKISEEVNVEIQANTLQVNFESIVLPDFNSEMIRLVMLNASQSVALNRFSEITEALLIETNEHTKYLEARGKLNISGNKLITAEGEIEARKIVVATDPTTAISWLNLESKKMYSVTTWYFKADKSISSLLKAKPILFVDAQKTGPLTNAVVITNAAPSYAPHGEVLVSASAISPNENADLFSVKKHLSHLFGVNTDNWQLIKEYKIKEALPEMTPPFSLVSSNQISKDVFVAGDHRVTSSIQGALLSGTNTATLVKVSLGL